jgi:hypothetical protein
VSFLGPILGDINPFAFGPDLGGPSVVPGNGTPAKTNTVTTQPWYATLFSNASSVLNSVLAYNVQQNQVNHGQTPSVGAPGGNQPLGVGIGSLAPIVPLLVVVAIFLVIFKLASGGRR